MHQPCVWPACLGISKTASYKTAAVAVLPLLQYKFHRSIRMVWKSCVLQKRDADKEAAATLQCCGFLQIKVHLNHVAVLERFLPRLPYPNSLVCVLRFENPNLSPTCCVYFLTTLENYAMGSSALSSPAIYSTGTWSMLSSSVPLSLILKRG
jgi:hypothetical protein